MQRNDAPYQSNDYGHHLTHPVDDIKEFVLQQDKMTP